MLISVLYYTYRYTRLLLVVPDPTTWLLPVLLILFTLRFEETLPAAPPEDMRFVVEGGRCISTWYIPTTCSAAVHSVTRTSRARISGGGSAAARRCPGSARRGRNDCHTSRTASTPCRRRENIVACTYCTTAVAPTPATTATTTLSLEGAQWVC